MSLRNVTLTAVAALSLGMAANAQTTTITVPMGDPGTAAPAATAPGTTVTVTGGQQTVETTGATERVATPERPAPAAGAAESAASAATGTAAADANVSTPTPTASVGEPPAAPMEGLPAAATDAQVNAPVPATAEAPAAEAAPAATATEAPAATEAEPAEAATAEEPAATDAAPEGTAADQPEADPAAQDAADPAASDAVEAETQPEAATEEGATAETEQAEAAAAEEVAAVPHQVIHDVSFSFEGPFGKYDQFQLQRGLQVYTEVCAGCHGMKFVPLRTLGDAGGPGLPEDQVRAYAAAMSIDDAETGEERPRVPTDMFPTVTGDGMGPDLSLMAKARAGFHGPYGTGLSQLFNGIGGPEYIYSILTGYTGEEKEQAGTILYENTAFPGGWISMAPPLSDDQVTFEDGSPSDLHSASKDVAAFLMWTAEPKMMARKKAGLVSVLFLIVLSALLYLTNKRIWWPIKHRDDVVGDGR